MENSTTFTEGKIMKSLIVFAMPVLMALFLQAIYGAGNYRGIWRKSASFIFDESKK